MRSAVPRATDGRGISRFPCGVFPCMHGVSDRAGSQRVSRYRRVECGLPPPPTASAPRSGSWISRLNTRPACPLSTLRPPPRGGRRMTRGRCGSLRLHRTTLAFATPRRFDRRTGGSDAPKLPLPVAGSDGSARPSCPAWCSATTHNLLDSTINMPFFKRPKSVAYFTGCPIIRSGRRIDDRPRP